ncbi:MAG: AbrB/MazE/SpoVT family DNA-binding domain-containing protein [Cyanobacteria bacterium P01_F01_bin.86]
MEIELRKWGNSIGFRIPQKIAESLGFDEHSIVELTEAKDSLVITKKREVATLDDLLASIPEGFEYLTDVNDFTESGPVGQEVI